MVNEKTNYVEKTCYADNSKAKVAGEVLLSGGIASAASGVCLVSDAYLKRTTGTPYSEVQPEEGAGILLALGGTIVATVGLMYLCLKE